MRYYRFNNRSAAPEALRGLLVPASDPGVPEVQHWLTARPINPFADLAAEDGPIPLLEVLYRPSAPKLLRGLVNGIEMHDGVLVLIPGGRFFTGVQRGSVKLSLTQENPTFAEVSIGEYLLSREWPASMLAGRNIPEVLINCIQSVIDLPGSSLHDLMYALAFLHMGHLVVSVNSEYVNYWINND